MENLVVSHVIAVLICQVAPVGLVRYKVVEAAGLVLQQLVEVCILVLVVAYTFRIYCFVNKVKCVYMVVTQTELEVTSYICNALHNNITYVVMK